MLYSGGLPERTVADIVAFNQNNSKLSHLGIWGGVGGFRNQFMSFTEQGHGCVPPTTILAALSHVLTLNHGTYGRGMGAHVCVPCVVGGA